MFAKKALIIMPEEVYAGNLGVMFIESINALIREFNSMGIEVETFDSFNYLEDIKGEITLLDCIINEDKLFLKKNLEEFSGKVTPELELIKAKALEKYPYDPTITSHSGKVNALLKRASYVVKEYAKAHECVIDCEVKKYKMFNIKPSKEDGKFYFKIDENTYKLKVYLNGEEFPTKNLFKDKHEKLYKW